MITHDVRFLGGQGRSGRDDLNGLAYLGSHGCITGWTRPSPTLDPFLGQAIWEGMPGWMTRAGELDPDGSINYQLAQIVGGELEQALLRIQIVRTQLSIQTARDEGLDRHGQERGIPRFSGESDDIYALRIIRWSVTAWTIDAPTVPPRALQKVGTREHLTALLQSMGFDVLVRDATMADSLRVMDEELRAALGAIRRPGFYTVELGDRGIPLSVSWSELIAALRSDRPSHKIALLALTDTGDWAEGLWDDNGVLDDEGTFDDWIWNIVPGEYPPTA